MPQEDQAAELHGALAYGVVWDWAEGPRRRRRPKGVRKFGRFERAKMHFLRENCCTQRAETCDDVGLRPGPSAHSLLRGLRPGPSAHVASDSTSHKQSTQDDESCHQLLCFLAAGSMPATHKMHLVGNSLSLSLSPLRTAGGGLRAAGATRVLCESHATARVPQSRW